MAQALEAWRASGRAKVLAEPCLVTVSGRPATVSSGGAIPVPVLTADNQVTVQFRHVGTRLDVVPIALGNGMIRLGLRAEVSELDRSRRIAVGDQSLPAMRVRTVDTMLELAAGQTMAISGLIQSGERALAGDDGQDNSSVQDVQEETELVVLATVQLVGAAGPPVVRQAARQLPGPPSPPALARPYAPAPIQLAPAAQGAVVTGCNRFSWVDESPPYGETHTTDCGAVPLNPAAAGGFLPAL